MDIKPEVLDELLKGIKTQDDLAVEPQQVVPR